MGGLGTPRTGPRWCTKGAAVTQASSLGGNGRGVHGPTTPTAWRHDSDRISNKFGPLPNGALNGWVAPAAYRGALPRPRLRTPAACGGALMVRWCDRTGAKADGDRYYNGEGRSSGDDYDGTGLVCDQEATSGASEERARPRGTSLAAAGCPYRRVAFRPCL